MIPFFNNLFPNDGELKELLEKGAVVVDVRNEQEYALGHAKGSVNIPVNSILSRADELRRYEHIIVCCMSGVRSTLAKEILLKQGFTNVVNGGSWTNVQQHCGRA